LKLTDFFFLLFDLGGFNIPFCLGLFLEDFLGDFLGLFLGDFLEDFLGFFLGDVLFLHPCLGT
jgi:hypothetical protein